MRTLPCLALEHRVETDPPHFSRVPCHTRKVKFIISVVKMVGENRKGKKKERRLLLP
jgi:hypothetical protein